MSSTIKKLNTYRGQPVEVITGADKGKKGRILNIRQTRKSIQVKVEGVRLQKKHDKKEGIKTQEGFIDFSNIKLDHTQAAASKSELKKLAPSRSSSSSHLSTANTGSTHSS